MADEATDPAGRTSEGQAGQDDRSPGRRAEDRAAHSRLRLFDRFLPGIIIAVLVTLAVLSVISVSLLKTSDKLDATTRRMNSAIAGSCERLQIARDDLNTQAWVQYRVIKLSQQQGNEAEIQRLLALVDPDTRKLIVTLLSGATQANELYPIVLRQTRYAPPTDCRKAVQAPGSYRAPVTVPFRLVARCFNPRTNQRPQLDKKCVE